MNYISQYLEEYLMLLYFWIMSQYDLKFDLKIDVGHSDIHSLLH